MSAGGDSLRAAGRRPVRDGLRQVVVVVPMVAAILWPLAVPVTAVVVAGVLFSFDRFSNEALVG